MIMTSYSSEEVGKKVRVMFPPVIQPDEPDEPESDLGSESQLSTATTATAESPFLPKVKARRNMVADNELLQRRKKRYVASKIFKVKVIINTLLCHLYKCCRGDNQS